MIRLGETETGRLGEAETGSVVESTLSQEHEIESPSLLLSKSPSLSLLLVDPPADGAWNMAVDEALLEAAAEEGQCTVRFYQWAKPTLSLGYFQSYEQRSEHVASRNCNVVRRASGGGAILHDHELTYSIAVPEGHPLAVNRLAAYRMVHESLIRILKKWGVEAKLFEADQGSSRREAAQREPFLCFKRRASGDVIVGNEKIAGSAQRRCRGAVLQHGSVLLAKSSAAPELNGLKELCGRSILVEEILKVWLEELSGTLAIAWRRDSLSERQRRRAERLVAEKYASATWTNAR